MSHSKTPIKWLYFNDWVADWWGFLPFSVSSLFFISASFGDLDKEGRLHRSLYQIGLTPKMRHQP